LVENELAGISAPNVGVRQWLGVKIAKTGQSFHAAKLKVSGNR